MPLLQYRCRVCNALFDTLISVSQMHTVRCERCNGEAERAYEGACLFGMAGSSAGRGASCTGDCGSCGGCESRHGSGCDCGACH
ncbi:MAG: hypothetical protein FWF69_09405 [Firmicutes bacterium]|nr:hypothetical protein [Bacillota bacterium]